MQDCHSSDNSRVLVVGTTPDYIEWIRRACPGRALFLTDPSMRSNSREPVPYEDEEVLCDLSRHDSAWTALRQHMDKWGIHAAGIVCFDCESMLLAAKLAAEFSLEYPSAESILNCRDKYRSKILWRQNGINCPDAKLINTPEEAIEFLTGAGGPCVTKPLNGTGSELVFRSDDKDDFARAVRMVLAAPGRREGRCAGGCTPAGAVVEEYLDGPEYSCDFILDNNSVSIIRLTRKLPSPSGPFGTIRGYVFETTPPEALGYGMLEDILKRAATALGISKAVCMVDFIVRDNEVYLLEMTPRPGGDCIPALLRRAAGLDTIKLAIDFAYHGSTGIKVQHDGRTYVGLRLHAQQKGVLKDYNSRLIEHDEGILEVSILGKPGDSIILPPEDYESWLLGHVIFIAKDGIDINIQCDEIIRSLDIEIEPERQSAFIWTR